MRKIKFRAWHKGREEFREGVIATLLLDQQSGHKPTNEHFADRITLLFDHYCYVEDITNEVIKKIEGLAVSNKGEISLHKKLGEHLTEVGAYNTALSDVIELLKQPEKQEIEIAEEMYSVSEFIYHLMKYNEDVDKKKYTKSQIATNIAKAMLNFFDETEVSY